MGFKTVARKAKVADNPVDFFQGLRPRKIAALYDQQAQLLREYASKGQKSTDVAIQGATGSGKTLVGLVLAEWRRQNLQERPVYLCPTKQLVHQVANFAQDQLGLPAYAFVGSKHDFSVPQKNMWLSGDVLAIATYSAVFNTNPFFAQPNFIVVDDAHAADQYIGEYWTVRVAKYQDDQRGLFDALVNVLSTVLPGDECARLLEDPRSLSDSMWVQMVPTPFVIQLEEEISSILDHAQNGSVLSFRWQVLKGHLGATQMFISPNEIIFKPIIPPTASHEPFSSANQRLYMSATLGRGGELERLSGRKQIKRLPSPHGWDGHGVGRRFFVLPNASLTDEETTDFLVEAIQKAEPKRALILTADDRSEKNDREVIADRLPDFSLYSAREIEISKEPFVNNDQAVALVANRYDGIDFPDDECRFLVLDGKPSGMSLLERFLSEKIGARSLYAERTRTRIIQAFGRCTRSAKDYAIVCVAGHNLMDDLLRNEWRRGLDKELQAELRFGEVQSQNTTKEDLLELVDLFLAQGEEWREAEAEIANFKEDFFEELPEGLENLENAAKSEIDYINALWRKDYARSLDAAHAVLASLEGGSELRGYRGMWQYLAGCAAFLLSKEEEKIFHKAEAHFSKARTIAGIRVKSLMADTHSNEDVDTLAQEQDTVAIQALEANLTGLGLTAQKGYIEREVEILEGIMQDEAKKFEASHVAIGALLGFDAQNSEEQGAPDPRWLIRDQLCFVFEDHMKENSGDMLSLEKARQAASHPKWVRSNIKVLKEDADIIPILITNAGVGSEDCQLHLEGVAVWHVDDFRAWVKAVLQTIRSLRAQLTGLGDMVWRSQAIVALEEKNATPSSFGRMISEKIIRAEI